MCSSSGPFCADSVQQNQNLDSNPSSADENVENVQEEESQPAVNEEPSASSGNEQLNQQKKQNIGEVQKQLPPSPEKSQTTTTKRFRAGSHCS